MEANKDKVTRHDLRHDRHTVSLLTDHLVFSPKYRGKVLEGEVADAAEEIIRNLSLEKKYLYSSPQTKLIDEQFFEFIIVIFSL